MLQENEFKLIADSLKGYSELSKSKEKEIEHQLTSLLQSADVARIFTKELLNPIKLSRPVLRVLVNTVERKLKEAEDKDDQKELNDKLFDLLEVIIKLDKIDSNARWMALSVYLNYAVLTQANRVFRETLSNIEKLNNNYDKHIFKHLIPDGGMPFLLRLISSRQPLEIIWLKDLLKIVVSKIKPGSISQLTKDEMILYIYKLVEGHRSLTIEAKPIINLAIKVNEENQAFEKELDALLTVLETASSKSSSAASEWQEEVIAIKHRHAGTNQTTHHLPVLEKGQESIKSNGEISPDTTEKESQANYYVNKSVKNSNGQGMENDDLIKRQRQVIKNLSVNINQLEHNCIIIERLEQENRKLKDKVVKLNKYNGVLNEQISNLNQRCADIQRSLQAKEQHIQKREQYIKDLELRQAEELAIVKHDVSLEMATFRSKLWGQLRGSLDEALDESIVSEQLPVNERIYLNRLRKILQVLKSNNIADEKAGG